MLAGRLVHHAENYNDLDKEMGWKTVEYDWEEVCDDCKNGSGNIENPDKPFYLKLAADVIREVNNDRTKECIIY